MLKVQKKLQGVVVKKSSSTAKVRIHTLSKHPKYGKYVSKYSGILVDVPVDMPVAIGQSVWIVEGRPISKLKCWSVVSVV